MPAKLSIRRLAADALPLPRFGTAQMQRGALEMKRLRLIILTLRNRSRVGLKQDRYNEALSLLERMLLLQANPHRLSHFCLRSTPPPRLA